MTVVSINPASAREVALWMATCHTGISSETMALWLGHGLRNERWPSHNYPHDPDDFDRCLRLLQVAPSLRPELHQMAKLGPVWAALVARWDEIEQCHLDEVGLGWTKGRSADKTYALMREVIDSARKRNAAKSQETSNAG